MFNLSRLHNKLVFITGASAGIGRATAVLFASLGANVIITARRASVLDEVAAECLSAHKAASLPAGVGGKVHAAAMDMQSRASIDSVLSPGALPDWAAPGKVDVLVNSAGLVLGVDKIGQISPDEVDTMVQTNVVGLIHLTQAFVRLFKERKPAPAGHVINLGSIAGREAYPGGSIYCATKFAVNAFTSALMKELVDTQIRVSEVQRECRRRRRRRDLKLTMYAETDLTNLPLLYGQPEWSRRTSRSRATAATPRPQPRSTRASTR